MATRPINLNDVRDVDKVYGRLTMEFERLSFTDPLSDVEVLLEEAHQEYFDNRAGPSGEPWQEWYFRSLDAPEEHPTLEVSGALRDSMRTGGTGNISEITDRSLTWGSGLVYAGIQNFGATFRLGVFLIGRDGGRIPPGTEITIPQREFMGLTDEKTDEITALLAESVIEQIKRGAGQAHFFADFPLDLE